MCTYNQKSLELYKKIIYILNSIEKTSWFRFNDKPCASIFICNANKIPLKHSHEQLLEIIDTEYVKGDNIYNHWPRAFVLEEICLQMTAHSWPDIYNIALDILNNGRPYHVSINSTYTRIFLYDFCMNKVYSQSINRSMKNRNIKVPLRSKHTLYTIDDQTNICDDYNISLNIDGDTINTNYTEINVPAGYCIIHTYKEFPSGNLRELITLKPYNEVFDIYGKLIPIDKIDYYIKWRTKKRNDPCKFKFIKKVNNNE